MEMVDLKKIFAIAKFETKKHRTKDEKKVIAVMLILGLLVYGSVSVFMELGIAGNEVFYRFNTDDGRIQQILEGTGKFHMAPEAEADIFIEVEGEHIFVFADTTDRGKAAVFSLESAIKDYNNMIFEQYDEMYAFPIRVNIIELERDDGSFESALGRSIGLDSTEPESDPDGDTMPDDMHTEDPIDEGDEADTSDSVIEDQEHDDGTDEIEDSSITTPPAFEEDDSEGDYISAQDINPFSQFNVLIIVIILTLPLAMISLVYSNSMMAEKINKRGIFLLMSPISKLEIIAGKTLPYLLLAFSVFLPVIISNTATLRSGIFASLVALTVIMAYLSISFTSAMLSRSHKELSFIAIFFISLYSCYLLIPAFMMNFSLISLASPLTIIAKLFRGEIIGIQLFFFSVVPTLVSSLVIFFAGSKLINDTNMFSYESITSKIKSAVYQIVRKRELNIFFVSFFSVPLIFLIQLMMIVVLLSLRNISALFLLMFFGALVEEIFKNIAPYTLIQKNRKKATTRKLAIYSGLTGSGFFVAEKTLMFIMIAPFLDAYSALIMSGFIFPLVMHTLISFVFCLSARRFKHNTFTISVMIATIIHFMVNLGLSLAAIGGIL